MSYINKYIILIFLMIFISAKDLYSTEYKKYEKISFVGLKLLTKEQVVNGSGIVIKNNIIYINTERLNDYLSNKTLIKNYKLIDKINTLIIMVKEKVPFLTIGIKKNERIFLCEVDDSLSLVSSNTIYGKNNPLLLMSKKQFNGGQFINDTLRLLFQLKKIKSNLAVWTELSEVDMRDKNNLVVTLTGRKTKFVVSRKFESFENLNNLVAYLDKVVYFPERLVLKNNFVVIK